MAGVGHVVRVRHSLEAERRPRKGDTVVAAGGVGDVGTGRVGGIVGARHISEDRDISQKGRHISRFRGIFEIRYRIGGIAIATANTRTAGAAAVLGPEMMDQECSILGSRRQRWRVARENHGGLFFAAESSLGSGDADLASWSRRRIESCRAHLSLFRGSGAME